MLGFFSSGTNRWMVFLFIVITITKGFRMRGGEGMRVVDDEEGVVVG